MGSPAYDAIWGTALRTTTRLHQFLDRLSGGRLGRSFPGGAQVVWITTLGRRSKEWRRTPLLAAPDSGGWIIAGSNAGQEKVPGWVFNVREHQTGTLEADGATFSVTFVELVGEEASIAYRLLAERWSAYAMYERNIRRTIPVFRAEPVT